MSRVSEEGLAIGYAALGGGRPASESVADAENFRNRHEEKQFEKDEVY